MTDWWGREIMESDEAALLAGHGVVNDRTDFLKVGSVFLGSVMLMKAKVVR